MSPQNQDLAIRRPASGSAEFRDSQSSVAAPPADNRVLLKLEITAGGVLTGLALFILFLFFANLGMLLLNFHFQYDDVYNLTRLFNFSDEKNIPTLFSSLGLIFCAALLTVIAVIQKRLRSAHLLWSGLAVVFLFLSIDEFASLHERLTLPMRESLDASGFLYFSWVVPYGVALVGFGLLYLRFLTRLPRRTMVLFLISGLIYVTGAMGLEMLGGWRAEAYGSDDLIYLAMVTAEELLEMVGIAIFIYALLSYIAEHLGDLRITTRARVGSEVETDQC